MRFFHTLSRSVLLLAFVPSLFLTALAEPGAIRFEPNHGQTDPAVAFLARSTHGTVFLTAGAAVLHLPGTTEALPTVLTLRFGGTAMLPQGLGRLSGVTHYFRGSDPTDWVTDVPGFAQVRYTDRYPGVDLLVGGGADGLGIALHAATAADLHRVAWTLEGASFLALAPNGDLLVHVEAGVQRFPAPRLMIGAEERASQYVLASDGQIGIALASVQPATSVAAGTLEFSTLLGSSGDDRGFDIVVDAAGSPIATGVTDMPDFPASAVFPPAGGPDVFVTKLTPNGTDIVFSAIIGGTGPDFGHGIALLPDGTVYVAGETGSSDFPVTPGAFDTSFNGGGMDAFVLHLAPDGAGLIYSTYLGGPGGDFARSVQVGDFGTAHVTGAASAGFPTTPGVVFPAPVGGLDAFVTELTPDGSGLIWSTYLGGTDDDIAHDLALFGPGEVFVTGETVSGDYPVTPGVIGALPAPLSDAFVTGLTPGGTGFVYSTYLGGTSSDFGEGIVLDAGGTAYIAGITESGFPVTPGAVFTTPLGLTDAFFAVLNPSATVLDYSTYLGGSDLDFGCDVTLDATSRPVVVGKTASADFPTTLDASQPVFGGITDGFFSRFDLSLSGSAVLTHSTFIGGSNPDIIHAVDIGPKNLGYVTGFAESFDFPVTPGAFDTSFNGGITDAFVASFETVFMPDLDLTATATSATAVVAGGAVMFSYTIANNTASPATGDLFFTAQVTPGGPNVASGVIRSGTLPALTTVSGTYTQPIPGGAPVGLYPYQLRIGRSPVPTANQANFLVEVIGPVLREEDALAQAEQSPDAELLEYGNWEVGHATPWVVAVSLASSSEASTDGAVGSYDAYPNPFARSTEIGFSLESASDVSLVIYDVRGREVAHLVDGTMEAGQHSVTFDAASLPSGVYIYRLQAGTQTETGRMTLLQ